MLKPHRIFNDRIFCAIYEDYYRHTSGIRLRLVKKTKRVTLYWFADIEDRETVLRRMNEDLETASAERYQIETIALNPAGDRFVALERGQFLPDMTLRERYSVVSRQKVDAVLAWK